MTPERSSSVALCVVAIDSNNSGDARRALGGGSSAGGELPVELSLRFEYRAGANMTKIVAFTRLDDGEVDTIITDAVA